MIFLGSTFLTGDIMSITCTPIDIDNIDYVEIGNAEFDGLNITNDVTFELTNECPNEWNFDTILSATFDGNTLAGNVDFSVNAVSDLLIKRKKYGDFTWTTLQDIKINSVEDFNVVFKDVTCQNHAEYQYAAVPVLNTIEGRYSIADVKCDTHVMLIADDDEVWVTEFVDGFCDTTTTAPSTIVTTMYDKYPTIIRNTNANYETVNVSAGFFAIDPDTLKYVSTDDAKVVDYIRRCKEFLNNGKTKLLKNIDGRMWLGYTTTPTSDSADGYYLNRKINFTLTEIGDPTSEEDLYDAGLISATEEWWNQ